MKTAISLLDYLFAAAAALAEFVAKYKASKITERLDAVYGVEESRLDSVVRRAQRKVIRRAEW